MNASTMTPRSDRETDEQREYRWLFALTFPAFLLAVVCGRIGGAGARRGRSLMDEARAAAHEVLPHAFMH